jgi:hypothetical protein
MFDEGEPMTLTDAYLAAVAERGPRASDVLTSAIPSVTDTMYMGRSLSRPVFLARDEVRGLIADLDVLYSALNGLPERIFGGDLAAFARAVGLTEPQVRAVVRGRGPAPSRMARADLYKDEDGFHLLELNMGSNVGGLDNTELNLAMLEHPFIAEFVAEHGLTYVDTMPELVQTLLVEAKVPTGVRPFVAIADWPDSYPELKDQLQKSSRLLAPLGLDCQPCSVEELEYHDDGVWLGDRRVDVVYRLFVVEDVVKPGATELLEPVLQAVERGQVAIFAPMDSDLYGSKGALALLSDEVYRDRYTAEELAVLDRLVPWTRMVRPGPVTVAGERQDLLRYAESNQAELVLKPVAEHAGQGVVLGWETDENSWRDGVRQAMDGPYILQQRIRAVPEAFPTDDGTEDWVLTWGALTVASGYGGMWVRGARATESGVVNMATGATATCCFHQE